MPFFGGIEGGASHSTCIICDETGDCISILEGLGTNHWQIGMDLTIARLAEMVESAKELADISEDTPLDVLGLSLSGLGQKDKQQELEDLLRSSFPDLAKSYVCSEDTIGSIYTASPNGDMVLISGTGSNAHLINPDGSSYNCGGWGQFIGDEGSAFQIALRAVKIVFDDMDGLRKAPYPIDDVWNLIKGYFKIKNRGAILPHLYKKFDKSFFARLCVKLAHAADEGDCLAKYLFDEAGENLGGMAAALIPKVQTDELKSNPFKIVCVGSVWLSLTLLVAGFLKGLQRANITFDINLVQLKKSSAFGACYHAVDAVGLQLPRNYPDNFDVLVQYSYKSKCLCNQ
uniref:N-acetyl-D-glucosamine kinase n=1 Tax=Glossina pallidipes TaxID=7398 RepID=A0A1B0A2Q0_GLOPL